MWEGEQKVKALANLSLALVRARQKKQAEKVWVEVRRAARSIRDSEQQNNAVYNLVMVFVQIQAWDRARVTVSSIQDRLRKSQALRELGIALAQAQHQEEAKVLWAETRELTTVVEKCMEMY